MSALSQARGQLSDEISKLSSHWLAVTGVWNDGRRAWFETQYWQDYEPAVRRALEQMEQIGQLFDQAERDLED